MFPNFNAHEPEIILFALVLLRMTAFFISWPMFSLVHIPAPIKVLFALAVAICVFPVVLGQGGPGMPQDMLPWLAMKEVIIGLILGFFSRLLFYAINIAGNLMATAMGLTSAQMFNPNVASNQTTVEFFYVLFGFIFFLAINGHHVFISGLATSFEIIPPFRLGINIAVFGDMGQVITSVFIAGIQMASPILVVLFIVNMTMGIVGRAVPQLNVLVTGIPVNILAGLFVMIVAMPLLVPEMRTVFSAMLENFFGFLKQL